MEKVIERIHYDMEMLEPYDDKLSLRDYGNLELYEIMQKFRREDSEYRKKRFSEYQKLSFPHWKKISLRYFSLPSLNNSNGMSINVEGKGEFRSINEMSHSDRSIFEELDFEGSDRKIMLLADVFHSNGYIFNSFKSPIKIGTKSSENNPSYTTNLFIIPENTAAKIHVENTSKGLQVMNNRFLLRKNAKLDILLTGNTDKGSFSFVNNFYMQEDNSELRIMDFNISEGTAVPHHFIMGKGKKTKSRILPAFLAVNHGQIDSQYVIKLFGRESHGIINGIGVLKDFTKAIFRPSVHISKGAKGVTGKEQSNIIMLSENSR
ncbi:MAG: SufD family Fe-S cluster assembly protein, partial [Petrotogales bacterium]